MVASVLEEMASEEVFIPTLIANAPEPQEIVVGDIIKQLTCTVLTTGQALIMVGGYIVRASVLSCRRRARATRHANGAFDVPQIRFCQFALPAPPEIAADLALPIVPELGSPSPRPTLLPILDQQAADEERVVVHERVQHYEGFTLDVEQQLQRQQQQQQQIQQHDDTE